MTASSFMVLATRLGASPLKTEKQARLALFVILLSTLIVLWPTTKRGFSGSDDWGWAHDVPRRNTLTTIFDPFLETPNEGPSTYYIPLQSLVYLVFVGPLGEETGARCLRWALILAHLANGYWLWRLFRSLLLPPGQRARPLEAPEGLLEAAAVAGAGLFLLHPANLRTTTWIGAGVSHTLLLLLAGAACHLWLRWRRGLGGGWCYGGALAAAATASLLKETAATFPAILLLLALAAKRETRSTWTLSSWTRLAAALLPFAGLSSFILLMQSLKYARGHLANEWGGVSISQRVPLRVLDLLTLLLVPGRQADSLKLLLGSLIATALTFSWLRFRYQPLFAGLSLAALVLILPFCIHNFRPPHTLLRYLYLPSVAALPALAWAPLTLLSKASRRATQGTAAVYGMALLALIGAALVQFWFGGG